jgi:TolB-like protein
MPKSPGRKASLFCATSIVFVVLCVSSFGPSRPLLANQQQIESAAAKLAERLTKVGRKSVAVVDFTDLQGNVTELGRFLAEQLSVSLEGNASGIAVIDRTHLKAILVEHKLSTRGLIDPQTARQLGRIAGVDALATGTITPFGDSVNLSIKVLDTETARLLGAVSVDIPRTKAVDELLGRGVAGTAASGSSRDPSAPGPEASGGRAETTAGHVVQAQADVFLITAQPCRRRGEVASCQLRVLNTGKDRTMITFWAGNVVDDQGNQITLYNQLDFGSAAAGSGARPAGGGGGPSSELEPDLPVNLTLSRLTVAPEVRRITLILKFSGGVRGGIATLRNIPVL